MAAITNKQRLARFLGLYPVRKALFPHLGAFEIATLLALCDARDLLAPADQKYLDFRRDLFTDRELYEIREMARNGRHVILLGNALPVLKARIVQPLQKYPQPLHLWMVCRKVGPIDPIVLPTALQYVGGVWGASLPAENSELPWADNPEKLWAVDTNSTGASWSRSYCLKSNWPSFGVRMHGLVSWRTLYNARVDRIIWMDCHSSHDLLNFADFEDPSLDPLFSECLKCRKETLSAHRDDIAVLARADASTGPFFSSKTLVDPSTLFFLDMSADNRILSMSTTKELSGHSEHSDESHVLEMCLYTSCAPNHIAWYNH
jgi:hypothetical protein